MTTYKPPRENESSAEFWQRLREMAKTLEQNDPSPPTHSEDGTEAYLPERRPAKRVGEPKARMVDLPQYLKGAG